MDSLVGVIHNKILDLRSIKNMIVGVTSNDPILIEAINRIDKIAVQKWLQKHRNIEEKTVKELRKIARNLQIPGYQSLSKSTLIYLILETKNGTTDSITQGNEAPMYVG